MYMFGCFKWSFIYFFVLGPWPWIFMDRLYLYGRYSLPIGFVKFLVHIIDFVNAYEV